MLDLYLEIVLAMTKNGVSFGKNTYHDLLSSLFSGQYVLARDAAGMITTFCNYWQIEARDGGNMVFVVDCFNTAGRCGMAKMIRTIREQTADVRGAMWFHKYTTFDKFRFFPAQESIS